MFQLFKFSLSQNQSQQCGKTIFYPFDPVKVRLSLDTTNIQHEKMVLQLVEPFIEGFSVKSETEMEIDDSAAAKRKQPEAGVETKNKKKK